MDTFSASAYLLANCCRTSYHTTFCYHIDLPKFVDLSNYQNDSSQKQNLRCTQHPELHDHSLNPHNSCTDTRAWCLDDGQRRRHFFDISSRRILHCGPSPSTDDIKDHIEKEPIKVLLTRHAFNMRPKRREAQDVDPFSEDYPPSPEQTKEKQKEEGIAKPSEDGKKDEVPKKPLKGDERNKVLKKPLKDDEGDKAPKTPLRDDEEDEAPKKPSKDDAEDKAPKTPIRDDEEDEAPKKPLTDGIKDKAPKKLFKDDIKDKAPEKPLKDDKKDEVTKKHLKDDKKVEFLEKTSKDDKKDDAPKKISQDDKKVKAPEEPLDLTPVKEVPEKLPATLQSLELSEKTDETHKAAPPQDNKDAAVLSDDILDKLNCNLMNLEATFDKFVKKNKDFIKNLLEHLNFEKQKQVQLENNYCQLKQENDILKTSNEYLKMVNGKQLKLFAKELDKAIDENKTSYKKKIQQLELMILYDKENLQCYKDNELMLLETLENEKREQEKLRLEICNLKYKQTEILSNYMKVLYFLEDVKKTLNNSCGNKVSLSKRSFDSSGDSQTTSNTREVLRNAFSNGLESLNVRDLSVLHDAVQEQNQRLCHQNDCCGRNPATNISISHMSMIYSESLDDYTTTGYVHRGLEDYGTSSNLSFIPSRQKPDRCNVNFP